MLDIIMITNKIEILILYIWIYTFDTNGFTDSTYFLIDSCRSGTGNGGNVSCKLKLKNKLILLNILNAIIYSILMIFFLLYILKSYVVKSFSLFIVYIIE